MKSVNLNEFLVPQAENLIIIMYNQYYFEEVFQNKMDFGPMRGKWLFAHKENGESKLISPSELFLNDQIFDIQAFYEVLEETYFKWQKIMPSVPFPDIQIGPLSEDRSAFISYDKQNTRHIIYLGLRDLEALERFKFTVGHELGHLYFFFSGFQDRTNLSLKNKQFKDFLPWPMLIIGGICIGANISVLWEQTHLLIVLTSLVQIVFWSLYLAVNIFSRKRLENYSMEFFSDFFSLYFMGKVAADNTGLSKGGWNAYTHPAGNWRLSFIKHFPENSDLDNWQNPVELFSNKFSILNFYELEFTVGAIFHRYYLALKGKLLTLWRKRPKL